MQDFSRFNFIEWQENALLLFSFKAPRKITEDNQINKNNTTKLYFVYLVPSTILY